MNQTLAKKIKLSLYIFCGVVFVIVAALFIKVKMDNAFLLKNGVIVKGAVISKAEQTSSNRRGTKSNYEMNLSLFVDTSAPDPSKPKPQSFDEKMDALVAASKKRMQNQHREGYARVAIGVSRDSFRKYSLGQVVDVIHLKGEPESARLLVDLE